MATTPKIITKRLNIVHPATHALIIGPQVRHFQAMQGGGPYPQNVL
jgi:hypothetical protein